MSVFRTKLKIIKGKPDLTPLIDVLFLLLLFFMLSSSFVQITGIKINLPETVAYEGTDAEKLVITDAEKLVITLDQGGNYFFNDEKLKWPDLKEKLSHYAAKWRVDTVIIVADAKTEYGDIVKLMSLARLLNLDVYAATAPQKEKRSTDDEVQF
jgi:biopolymer transport protein ExbD